MIDKQCGIVLMRNENDILREYLDHITQWFDRLYVLDGSDDSVGKDICSDYKEVVFYATDKEFTDKPIRDGGRGYLYNIIKNDELCNSKDWVGVLHPDEFWHTNPLDIIEKCSNNFDAISVRSLHFFLHSSQKDYWEFNNEDSIELSSIYYMYPGFREHRIFRHNKEFEYTIDQHSLVIPSNIDVNNRVYHTNGIIKQYSYRTYDQVKRRVDLNIERKWQVNDFLNFIETDDIFMDTLTNPESYRDKYPQQYAECWYNQPYVCVKNIIMDGIQ